MVLFITLAYLDGLSVKSYVWAQTLLFREKGMGEGKAWLEIGKVPRLVRTGTN